MGICTGSYNVYIKIFLTRNSVFQSIFSPSLAVIVSVVSL